MTDPTTRPSPDRFLKIGSYKHRATLKATTKAALVDLAVRILSTAPELLAPTRGTLHGSAVFYGAACRAADLLEAAPSMTNLSRRIGSGSDLDAADIARFIAAVNRRDNSKQDWRRFVLALIDAARELAVEQANELRAHRRAEAAAADDAARAAGHAAARNFVASAKRRELDDRANFEGLDLSQGATVGEAMTKLQIHQAEVEARKAKRRADAVAEVERLRKVADAFSSEACTLDELARAARKREAQAVAAHAAAVTAVAEVA